MRDCFLTFGRPRIERDEIREVVDSLKSGWLSRGPKVSRFEEVFKKYMQVPHAVAVSSCTAALDLSLRVAGVGQGDEVITSPFTFAATANAIIHQGATPVFVDVDLETGNMDPGKIEEQITSRTRAILPVHFAGRPCPMENILAIARRHRLLVVQDAAHALEARYRLEKIGRWGDLTAFSFYATKNLAMGEGGMVTTRRREWAEKIRILSVNGMTKDAWTRYSNKGFRHYRIVLPGFNFNMTDLQAGIGIRQLPKIERYLKIRNRIWTAYDAAFSDLPLRLPPAPEAQTRHARHLYTVRLEPGALKIHRDQFMHCLHKMKIGTGVHFISLHLQPYYQKRFCFRPATFPNAAHLSQWILSLPLSAKMTGKDVDDVIWAVRKIARRYRR